MDKKRSQSILELVLIGLFPTIPALSDEFLKRLYPPVRSFNNTKPGTDLNPRPYIKQRKSIRNNYGPSRTFY